MSDAQFWAELPEKLRLHQEWQEHEAERMTNDLWSRAIKYAHRRKRHLISVEEIMALSERVGTLRRKVKDGGL